MSGTRVSARVLGGFEVAVDGRRLTRADWQRISAERLFKLLLITSGHVLSREVAAETLWPDGEPELGRANLRKAIHFAHRALRPAAILGGDAHTITLDPALLDLDLDRLQHAVRSLREHGATWSQARAGGQPFDSGVADRAIETIVELGGRMLLPDDPYEDWLTAPRERLLSRWVSVALTAAARARAAGRLADAHQIVDRVLEHDPTDEAAHRLAVELLAAEGRHHAVRRQIALCRQALRDGLDAAPSVETEEAFRSAERAAAAARHSPLLPRLVARGTELQRIEPLLDRVGDGHFAALVVRGPAGIGKSRLLAEIAGFARASEWRVVEWQAVESTQSLAYGPLRIGLASLLRRDEVEAMDEPAKSALATVLPDLGIAPAIAFVDASALLSALILSIGRLARRRPICFALDDLPWLDQPTLRGLATAAAGYDAPVLLAATLRDDETVPQEVEAFVDQVRRSGGLEISLGPLASRDVEPLIVAHMGGQGVDQALSRFAFEQSAGNPLFCLELVRTAHEQAAIRLDGDRWTVVNAGGLPTLPDTVRRLVARRAENLPAAAKRLVATAAELGSEVRFDALARALSDIDGGIMPALDAALESGLLVERGTLYAFAHPLYRGAVRGLVGTARRGRLRLRIAWAMAGPEVAPGASPAELEAAAASDPDPGSIAEHALSAWEQGIVEAQQLGVAYGFVAGLRERRLFNIGAAEALLERSVAAWRKLASDSRARFDAAPALIGLGSILALGGRDGQAEPLYREAAAAARTPRQLADAYYAMWELPYHHGDFEAALALARECLARLPEEAAVERANVQRDIAWCLARLRRLPEALEPTERAARTLERSTDLRGAARAVDQLAMVLSYLGQRERWVELEERALRLALDSHDSDTELIVRLHLGVALTRAGSPALARPVLERARELAGQMGHRYGQALEAWGAAEMEDELGNHAAAAEDRRRELTLLASIGGNPHNEAMAHAHLSRLSRLTGDEQAAESEANAARNLARRSGEIGYGDRIERALSIGRWLDMET